MDREHCHVRLHFGELDTQGGRYRRRSKKTGRMISTRIRDVSPGMIILFPFLLHFDDMFCEWRNVWQRYPIVFPRGILHQFHVLSEEKLPEG